MKMKFAFCHSIIIMLLMQACLFAQIDSLGFSNNEYIVGEIKIMERGVLVVETNYSDSDLKLEWDKVIWIKTQSHFMIATRDDTKYFSTLTSLNDSIVQVYFDNNQIGSCAIKDIVYINAYEDNFIDRISASIDVGFDMAKARNLRSLATRSMLAYKADKWMVKGIVNSNWSEQDDTEPIQRTEGEVNFTYALPHRFYAIVTQNFLSNTEQNLIIRSNSQIGLGLFFFRTNNAFWGGKLGLNRNNEKFSLASSITESDSTSIYRSWEGYIGTELNLFDIGDLSFNLAITVYPSITDLGRIRTDSNLNLKYDLPYDLYIRMGGSANSDNRANEASKVDYVAQFGFGWEW